MLIRKTVKTENNPNRPKMSARLPEGTFTLMTHKKGCNIGHNSPIDFDDTTTCQPHVASDSNSCTTCGSGEMALIALSEIQESVGPKNKTDS